MDQQGPAVAIARLRSTWDAQVAPSSRRALLALVFAVFFAGAHLARLGSPVARATAAGAFGVTLVALAVRAFVLRRRAGDARRVIRETVGRMDPELGAATLRGLALVERAQDDEAAGSPELARLHLDRLFARTSLDRLGQRASTSAMRWSTAGLVLAATGALLVLVEPFRIIEGLDVLAARNGEAPLALTWVDDVVMGVAPPEYLRQPSGDLRPFRATQQPRGSTITVRGRPLHHGRPVVLTDGATAVPFVDDGAGHVVARFTVAESATLWVAAEFGDPKKGGVRIRQPDAEPVTSIPDEAPKVKVDGAPRTVRLLEEPSIPIHYEATDDHGLREVDLVLRTGTREERRVLAHPAADVLVDRGGYEVQARDGFFRKVYAPVEITVEARDNDAVTGPKWGKSPAILVIPPEVGEAEALRYEALVKARDALTDLTAFRIAEKDAPGHLARELEKQATAFGALREALAGSYGGLQVRGRIVKLARGQLRRLDKWLQAEKKTPGAPAHEKLRDETEDVLLAFDSGLRGLAYQDAQTVAKRLADVAEDLAGALYAARTTAAETSPPQADPSGAGATAGGSAAIARADAGVTVLTGGGRQLLRLGELGLDLGEIVANDLRRVARGRQAGDLLHAELAARDLAARLRHPDPSFSGGGGHGGGGHGKGTESGAGAGADSGEASEADEEAEAMDRALEELAQQHQQKIDDVDDALERAMSNEDLDRLKQEAKQHADAIREAVKSLPPPRGDTGSAEQAAAQGREDAEAMAGALEGGRPRDAVENGRRAVQKLADAQRAAEQAGGFYPEDRAGREAAAARPTIEHELAWAEEALEKLRKAASARAKDDLSRLSKEEQKLADKAKALAKKGEEGDRSMPQDMLDRLGEAEQAMRDAEQKLGQGEGETGSKKQRDAQRLLEMARGEQDQPGSGQEGGSPRDDDGKNPHGKADVPGKDKHKGPEEFRKRVLQGLGGSQDPLLREAVKRYAEGLLK